MILIRSRPFLFGWIAQFKGIGAVGPIYFFLHYTFAQIQNFRALDQRLTNIAYTSTVLPVMIVAFYIPHFVSHIHPDLAVRHIADWIWQWFPLWVSALQFLLAKTVMPDTLSHDRLHAPLRDVLTIRITIYACSILAAAVWWYTLLMSPFSAALIFIPHLNNPQVSWTDCARNVLQYDHIFCWTSAILWLGYLFTDLKRAGMVTQSWKMIFSAAALSTLVIGPGATVGLGWLWREDILIHKKHKDAVVKA